MLFVISDAAELREIVANIKFVGATTEDSNGESCMCCGGPRLDWYNGRSRVALTALQHGRRLRWGGFSTQRVLGVRVGYGDAPLTEQSAVWLADWLTSHSGRDFTLKLERPARWVVFGSTTGASDSAVPSKDVPAEGTGEPSAPKCDAIDGRR